MQCNLFPCTSVKDHIPKKGNQGNDQKGEAKAEKERKNPNETCFSFPAKFTEFPQNVTATEGQNVEMSCAFQSGSASVYLEIQWWFLRATEDQETGAEVMDAQVPAHNLSIPLAARKQRFREQTWFFPEM